MTKQLIVATVLLITTSSCFASGWNDYQLDIGDGYRIYRCNSIEIGISRVRGNILTGDKSQVGPLQKYAITDDHIFAWHYGRSGWDIDQTKEYWFVIEKITDNVIGPVSREQFNELPEVIAGDPIDWQSPENPQAGLLALVPLGFLAAVIFIFYVVYQICYVSIDFIGRLFYEYLPGPETKTVGTIIKRIVIAAGILIPLVVFMTAMIVEANLPTADLHIGDGFRVYTPEKNYSMLLPAAGYHNTSSGRGRWDLAGPLQQYVSTDKYVFTKRCGKRFLDGRGQGEVSFVYNRPYEPDLSMEFFHVYLKDDKKSFGPIYREDFEARPEVKASQPLNWLDPPEPASELLWGVTGGIQFFGTGVIVFAFFYGWIIAIPMGLIALVRWCVKKKRFEESMQVVVEAKDD